MSNHPNKHHHQGGQHPQQGSRRPDGDDSDSEFQYNQDAERDDYASFGRRDGQQPNERKGVQHGRDHVGSGVDTVNFTGEGDSRRSGDLYGGESGTFGGDDDESFQARPSRTTEYTTTSGGGHGRQGGNQSSERRQQQPQHHQGRQQEYGDNEGRRSGRDHVGSGVDTVNFTGEGDNRRTGDLYGGESGTFGGDDETPQVRPSRTTESTTTSSGGYGRQGGNQSSERRQQQPQHHQGRQQEYGNNEGRHSGRDHVGSGVDTVNFTGEGDSRRTGDLYGGESGTFGGNEEYDVSSGGKYTPGAKVVLHAAEKDTEKNPYNDVATGFAAETQNLVKEELKSLGGKFFESLTGGKH